jgi:hypothetical protein
MNYARLILLAMSCACLFACSTTYGQLDLNNRFAFPNSDVVQPSNSYVSLEASSFRWFWQDPPNRQLYNQLLTDAISRTKGDLLINSVWATTTTIYPYMPFYTVKLQLNATAVNADIFEKRLY